MILVNLSVEQPELNELKATVDKLQALHEQFLDSSDIAEAFVKSLFNLSLKQPELNEQEGTVDKLQALHEQFPDSPDIALNYAKILFNLSVKQPELNEQEGTVDKLQALHEQFPDSPDIAEAFAMILVNVSTEQTELKELAATVAKLQVLHQQFPDSPDIALGYAKILAILSDKQPELKEREATVAKLQVLHQQFPDSPDIALGYAKILAILSDKQPELKEREATAEKLQALHQQFPDSPDIAEMYAMTLFNLSTKQTELNELATTAKKLKELHERERFQESEEIAFIYVMFLASLFEHQTELSECLQATKIIKQLYDQFSTFMLQNFDDRFFSNDNVCDSEEYKLFNFILREGLLKNTKYAILQPWAEHYKEESDELKNLLSIYQYVQKIKYQLGLKDEDRKENLKFGHYTRGSVLQSLLDQKEESNFSISGKTRLNNANYMNDPEEGIIIEKILGLDRRDALEPSSWFLMSFTSKTDDLAMWSQYGDDAQGVCIVLREDDFSRFTSFNDVSWRQEKLSLEFSDKMYLMKSELNSGLEKSIFRSESENSVDTVNDEGTEANSEEKGNVSKGNVDYLYRIAYVSYTDNNFELEQTELFDSAEIEELKTSLNGLKEKLDENSNKEDEFYQKAISDCIEEIRYLFKSVDYKYENELRILRYANLDSENTEIKIDKSSGMGKLYVERENPIQIGEVIFGPKFPNPEYVTPLLKLLDKDIVFKKSMIKFR
ncbi:DUF2971 domain-containing protein [uncultured Streptococcus sp.]|uniref:DUF2971 domain-containing protein n=1 Tax=uncultured Streptococcus sp. TaxID=83427 RepID=UPI0028F16842|nr:DUF2971 domain-containing protein [uncultured Streptococcus sp.]